MNPHHALCCIPLMNTQHNLVVGFVWVLTHRQAAPLKRAHKDDRVQKEISPQRKQLNPQMTERLKTLLSSLSAL